jgi:endonuclease/exonuclease/phosphatase family metal-dependent hydrolase
VPELRLLTYNVRSLRDDPAAVAAVVRACAPDVVAVQEAPRFFRWRSKRAALARRCGLVVATADREGGLMVMTSLAVQVRRTSFALLPHTEGLHQRAVCVADLTLRGADWRIASIHMSLDAEERQRHLPPLWAAVDGSGSASSGEARPALVVAGDVNEEAGGPAWDALATRLQDAYAVAQGDAAAGPVDRDAAAGYTFSTSRRRIRIDGIFADHGVEVADCRVVTDLPDAATVQAASDHFPVLATLRHPG